MTRQRQAELAPFRERYIAHRGLFDNRYDYPENTLPAFERAIAAGYGIELDVRLTRDNQLIVAHDPDLLRPCWEYGIIREWDWDELRTCHLFGTSQTFPLFTDVLDLIAGQVPLVVELKPDKDVELTAELTAKAMEKYDGAYCIECFDPRVLQWYKKHHPEVIRGQLAQDMADERGKRNPLTNWLLERMVLNVTTRPDFIAYRQADADRLSVRFWRAVLGCTLVAWTVQSEEQLAAAKGHFDAIIFDSFIPAEPWA